MREDILTGANLGRKLSAVNLCQPGEEPPLPAPCQEALERLGSRQLQVRLQHLEVQPETPVKRYLHKLHHRQDTPLRNILQNSTPLQRLLSATNSPAHAKQRLDFSMPGYTSATGDSPSRTWLPAECTASPAGSDVTKQGELETRWTNLQTPSSMLQSSWPSPWQSMNIGAAVPYQPTLGSPQTQSVMPATSSDQEITPQTWRGQPSPPTEIQVSEISYLTLM